MTVCRRPVASHVPRGAGNCGLLWVGTHRNPGKVPLRHANVRSIGSGTDLHRRPREAW
jgi:hypothetical protein